MLAVYNLCGAHSLIIHEILFGIDDYVLVSDSSSIKKRKYKLYLSSKGVYFNWGGVRYYMHEFTKINL